MVRVGFAGLSLALVLAAPWAQAQEQNAHVVIDSGEPQMKVQLLRGSSEEPLLSCEGRCEFMAPPGRYRVKLRDPSTGFEHEQGLRIKESSQFQLQPGDAGARTAGLVFGIAGPASIVLGMVLVLPALLASGCHGCSGGGENTTATIGVVMILGGIVATPVGWVVYAQNRTKLQLVSDLQDGTPPVERFRVGLGGVAPGALGLTGVAQF